MYNENDKIRFISTVNLDQYPNHYWNAMFAKSETMEEMYGKDLFNFSKIEIISMYKYFDSKSFDYLRVTNFNFIKYAQWALQEALIIDGQNHFAEITSDEINSCVNQYGVTESIITKKRLDEILHMIAPAKDRFMVIGIFEGIKGTALTEMLDSNINDIDFANKKMKLSSGRVIEVSDDLIRIAKEAAAETEYITSDGKQTYKLYGDPGSLQKSLRKNPSEANRIKIINKNFRSLFDNLGLSRYITPNSMFTSGLIYRINKFAEENGITAEEALNNEEFVAFLKNQYGYNSKIKYKFIMKYGEFLR